MCRRVHFHALSERRRPVHRETARMNGLAGRALALYSRLSLCGSPAHRYRTWLIARTCGQRNMTVSPLIEVVALWNSPLESATSNPSTGCDVAVATASALAESE